MIDKWPEHEGVFATAVPNHWRVTPRVTAYKLLEVPEAGARRAMLETGEAHAAQIQPSDWQALLDEGFQFAPEAVSSSAGLVFAGNYWEDTHPRTGEALERQHDTSKHG